MKKQVHNGVTVAVAEKREENDHARHASVVIFEGHPKDEAAGDAEAHHIPVPSAWYPATESLLRGK